MIRASRGIARFAVRPAVRQYNFASSQYAEAFQLTFPAVDAPKLRADTVQYLETFDAQKWHDDPVQSVLKGNAQGGESIDTVDAFGVVNGKQLLSSATSLQDVIAHCQSYQSPKKDLREAIRAIEAIMLSKHAAALIGNQALDFKKQDGVTEIEESLEANPVEHKMVDYLLEDEAKGIVALQRTPALVGAVSNFTNFLDLCRKTLRNLECGVPVVVLSRSQTGQQVYRWFQLLQHELEVQGEVDAGMLTFVSSDIEGQRTLMKALPNSPLYLTGSREVAAKIKELLPSTFASTGGPNTMVATEYTPQVQGATKMATQIENSGQCTAMRHLVAPGVSARDIETTFAGATAIEKAAESLKTGDFDSLYSNWGASFEPASGYQRHPKAEVPMAYRVSSDLPSPGVEEHWRRVYLDVTSPASAEEMAAGTPFLKNLAKWLVTEQPITLAVNEAKSSSSQGGKRSFSVAKELFENTSQVVYSVGGVHESAALTCQARPQEGEIFGEFPPRRDLTKYSKFPVVVPSPTPGYHAHYEASYLKTIGSAKDACGPVATQGWMEALLSQNDPTVRGYAATLAAYLEDATTHTPRRGTGQRTSLWGLQRPPLENGDTVLRLGPNFSGSLSVAVCYLLPFACTSAASQLTVSVHPSHRALALELQKAAGARPLFLKEESDETFAASSQGAWNVLHLGAGDTSTSLLDDPAQLPLVGHFVSVLFPMGHIKSTLPNDEEFVNVFSASDKWLRFLPPPEGEAGWAPTDISQDI